MGRIMLLTKPYPLLTVNEVADYLQIPVGTLYRWRTNGEGPPAIRAGKHLRYRLEQVDAWLDQHTATVGA